MLLNFVDRSFDVKRLTNYRLSIQISLNGFSFCVFDNGFSKHVLLRNYQYQQNVTNYDELVDEIEKIFSVDSYLSINYPHSVCFYISPKHTLIPEKFFAKEKIKTYLEFTSPLDDLDEIHYKQINGTSIYSIFVFPSPLANKLSQYYKKITYINQSGPLINYCINTTEENSISINLHDGVADMALNNNRQFKLHNSFEIFHLNDAVYYINALLHQFMMNARLTPIHISGDILREEIDELKKYFPMASVSKNHRMAMLIGQENAYRYFNLLTAHECE